MFMPGVYRIICLRQLQFQRNRSRLSRVEYAPKADRQQIHSFYMGKNTPARKDYIMENLVVPVEE